MTTTDLVVRTPGGLAEKIEYARFLAKSDLLPRVYQGKPENILLVTEFGEYLGIPPAAALRLIHVIDQKPVASAELLAGRVRERGHRMRVSYDQKTRTAVCSIWRADDPAHEFRTEWSWERATAVIDPKSGKRLTEKANWRNYYPAMLKWRAQTECIRDACPEVALGVSYTADELGAQELSDDEADELGVMTRHQRVEHMGLRRMNEPAPGAVEKLTEPDPDDPWATPGPEDVGPAAQDEMAPSGPAAGPAATPASKPALDKLANLWQQLSLDGDEQDDIIAWLQPGWGATRSQVQMVSSYLTDLIKTAQGDVEEARSQMWAQWRAANRDVVAEMEISDGQASE